MTTKDLAIGLFVFGSFGLMIKTIHDNNVFHEKLLVATSICVTENQHECSLGDATCLDNLTTLCRQVALGATER